MPCRILRLAWVLLLTSAYLTQVGDGRRARGQGLSADMFSRSFEVDRKQTKGAVNAMPVKALSDFLFANALPALYSRDRLRGAPYQNRNRIAMKHDETNLLRRPEAVVVGAGPAGLATAWVLEARGFDVTVLERRKQPSPYEPQRAYLYLIDGRGQQFTDAANITDELSSPALSVSLTNYTVIRALPNGERVEAVPPILSPRTDGRNSYWIPRQGFLALLCRALEGKQYVRVLYGSELNEISRTNDGGVEVVTRVSNKNGSDEAEGRTLRLHPSLLVGADGLNSIVRDSMAKWSVADPSLGATAAEFSSVKLPSPSTGLKYKMLRFPPSFRLNASDPTATAEPRKAYSIRPSKDAPLGPTRLGMLPVADATFPRTANVILPPGHPVWSLKSADEVRDWLKGTFPQLPIDDIVSKEEAHAFADGQPGAFPAPCYTPRQQLLLPSAAVLLVGDAVHAFPPDIGQGVNSALSDVMHLSRALDEANQTYAEVLDGKPDTKSRIAHLLERAMPIYGSKASVEAKAVAKIAQIGFPYQYGQVAHDGLLPRLKQFGWFANFFLRTFFLAKLAPRFFSPAAVVLVQQPQLTYKQILALATKTTRRMLATAFGFSFVMMLIFLRSFLG